jgi:hypothetical protein
MRISPILLFALFCFSDALGQCAFFDDYSTTAGWTQVGTRVQVATGSVRYINGAADADQRRVFKPLGFTLDFDDNFTAEFDFRPKKVGSYLGGPFVGHALLSLTAGTQETYNDCPDIPCTGSPPGTQDALVVQFSAPNPTDGTVHFAIKAREGSSSTEYTSPLIQPAAPGNFYIRLQRTSPTDVSLGVYEDPARTIHIPGSPVTLTIPSTISGLTHIQHGNAARGDYRRELTGAVDNTCIILDDNVGSRFNADLNLIHNNPVNSMLNFNLSETLNDIRIVDLSGQLVYQTTQLSPGEDIDLSHLATGTYFVQVEQEPQIFTRKESVLRNSALLHLLRRLLPTSEKGPNNYQSASSVKRSKSKFQNISEELQDASSWLVWIFLLTGRVRPQTN